MTEVTIHGRGGQGGVTLAKLIATSYFVQGKHVQAFGVYAAERSGAPVQAFTRIDDEEITNHNQIKNPDHVIVIDRALIGPHVAASLKPGGWIILNTPEPPAAYGEMFPGRNVASLDATVIAVKNGLGTRAVPIVNTTMLGAVANVLDVAMEHVEAALESVKFGGGNMKAAREAYDVVVTESLGGEASVTPPAARDAHVAGILDEEVGGLPKIHTGTWASRRPHRRNLTPPCNNGCPAGNDVQRFVASIADRDYTEALLTILETSPFPGICGRVCPAPCMEACNRSLHDESVNIRELERHASEHGQWPAATKPEREERIAVIGSGPAGLSAAYQLARLGYPVTMFEAGSELGGVMRTGIPAYRLPRTVLDHEISFIMRHGVAAKTNYKIDRQKLLDLTKDHAAVFIAAGLQETRALDLGPGTSNMVHEGIDFLDRARNFRISVENEHVVVVGGGNTAIDAARTARRLGAESVRIVYRRTRAEMPAIKEEVDESLEEHITLEELVSPLRIREDGVGALLTCQRMKLGEPDESGRRRPEPDDSEGSQFDIRCDRIILALGQSADLSILPEGSEIKDNRMLLGMTNVPVFVGGDFATNDGTVTAAIGSGRKAAYHVHLTLTGEDLFAAEEHPPVAQPDKITMQVFAHSPRQEGRMVDPVARAHSFTEVRLGLVDEPAVQAAVAEAERCFSCGVCNECDTCLQYCPEGVLLRDGETDYRFDYEYCKGCGVCATQCPRGVVYMAEL